MIVFFVSDRLAFGSKVRLNRHVEKLQALRITHVIDARYYPSKKLLNFKTIHLNFKDDGRPRPMWFYDRALRFYRIASRNPRTKVFVICRAGRRRSASLTYFLLRASGLSVHQAEKVVRTAPLCAQIVRAYKESSEAFLSRRHGKSRMSDERKARFASHELSNRLRKNRSGVRPVRSGITAFRMRIEGSVMRPSRLAYCISLRWTGSLPRSGTPAELLTPSY